MANRWGNNGDTDKTLFFGALKSLQMVTAAMKLKETCLMHPTWIGMHETSAQGWCTGMTQRDGMGREVGAGFRMGNTCKSMADSCQCMAKTTTIL